MSEFIATVEDINKFKDIYNTLNVLYHRYELDTIKDVIYIDSSKGELLPYLKLKSQNCNYHNYLTHSETILNNQLFKNFNNSTSIDIVKDSVSQTSLIYCNNVNIINKLQSNLNIFGYIIYIGTMNDNTLRIPGIEKVYFDESNKIHLFRRHETLNTVNKINEFSSLLPVINKYELTVTNSNVDIEVDIFKVNDNKIKLTMIRFDDEKLYEDDVNIKLYDVDVPYKYDILTVKFNNTTIHVSEHIVNVKISVDSLIDQKTEIPKIICQTMDTDVLGEIHIRTVHNLKCKNPEYKYSFYDAVARRNFIKSNFDSIVLETYDGFVSGAFKADIFRYCWLYMNGGFYVDCKMINRKSFRQIITEEQEHFICNDRIPNAYQNCVIGVKPKDNNILKCIYECISRFEKKINHRVSFGSLYHTGPYLFYTCMKEYKSCAIFKSPFDNDRNYKESLIVSSTDTDDNSVLFNVWFKGYYNKYKSIHKKPIWSEQWAKNEIYFSDRCKIDGMSNYYIYVYPNQIQKDELEQINFKLVNKEISNNIKDSLKCKLIDDINDIENMIVVNKK
tara:strand:- start:18968 stop:20647 length:1680 start_codon:yes stop_codon:yes gene_type:complete